MVIADGDDVGHDPLLPVYWSREATPLSLACSKASSAVAPWHPPVPPQCKGLAVQS